MRVQLFMYFEGKLALVGYFKFHEDNIGIQHTLREDKIKQKKALRTDREQKQRGRR